MNHIKIEVRETKKSFGQSQTKKKQNRSSSFSPGKEKELGRRSSSFNNLETSLYNNVNNYRHIFKNNSGRWDYIGWLQGMREIPPNIRAKGKSEVGAQENKKTVPIEPNFHTAPRNNKFNHIENPYNFVMVKGNSVGTSNEHKVYRGNPPNAGQILLEQSFRADSKIKETLDYGEGKKKKKMTFDTSCKSKNIPPINNLCVNDRNFYFNTSENFENEVSQTEKISNIPFSYLNESNEFKMEYNEKLFYRKNRLNKFSNINDFPKFPPPLSKDSQAAHNLNIIQSKLEKKMNEEDPQKNFKKKLPKFDFITRPYEYQLEPIIYLKDKIIKRTLIPTNHTSSLIGSHYDLPKFSETYTNRNLNKIRHILSDNSSLNMNKMISSYRCFTDIVDNRELITHPTNIFGKNENDYIIKLKRFSPLTLEQRKENLKELRNFLGQRNRSKDPWSNLDFKAIK